MEIALRLVRRAAGQGHAVWLWLALPLLVMATLFFYPLLLIVEQAFQGNGAG